jgi:nicotinamide N-methyltransferase
MDAMKEQMRSMEAERADMIAEVEAQIEHALQSMAVGIDAGGDDEYAFGGTDDEAMRITRSRKASVASLRSAARQMRSLGTESTLAPEEVPPLPKSPSEEKEQDPMHRFSVTGDSSDAMVAVDEGISKQSDQIAEKVARIQAKVPLFHGYFQYVLTPVQLEGALASEPAPAPVPRWKGRTVNNDSESEYSADDIYTPRAPRRRKESSGTNSNRTSATVARPSSSRASRPPSAQSHKPPSRASRHRKNRNSMTGSIASSVLSGTATVKNDSSDTEGADERASHRDLPRLATATEIPEEEARESMVKPTKAGPPSAFPTSMSKAKAKASPSTPSLTPGPVASTDDSDSDAQDYQSAYSMSRPVSTLDPLSPYQVSR